MIAELKRLEESRDGIIGILSIDKEIQCFILENRNRQNKPNVSCIPAGSYFCRRIESPKFNETFEVCDVPDRSGILFHQGNTADDTYGCLLPGRRAGHLYGKRAVLESGRAFVDLMEKMSGIEKFKFVITECF